MAVWTGTFPSFSLSHSQKDGLMTPYPTITDPPNVPSLSPFRQHRENVRRRRVKTTTGQREQRAQEATRGSDAVEERGVRVG